MKNFSFLPKGRRAIPDELVQFGRHLVYSEGTRTEPFYVDNIREKIADKYNCRQNDIELVPATRDLSYNTVSLVNYALRDTENRLTKGEKIDHVWIMFDKDDFTDFEKAHEEILKLNNSKKETVEGFRYNKNTHIVWHSCWSNESFELWLCLYFSYYTSGNSRADYINHLENSTPLKNLGFKYTKNRKNIHDILVNNGGSIETAIKFARRLEQANKIGNPSTGVYLFAEYFLPYMKK